MLSFTFFNPPEESVRFKVVPEREAFLDHPVYPELSIADLHGKRTIRSAG